MSYEEQKEELKPIIEFLDATPCGERIASSWEPPEGYRMEKLRVGNVPVERLIPDNSNGKLVYQFHGGGYVLALSDMYREIAIMLSKLAEGAEVINIDYRIAPTYQAPAALEDAVEVYQWLQKQGYKAEDILFVGDSAGGHLELATALYLKDNSIPLPKGIIAMSPLTCPEAIYPSIKQNYDKDLFLGKQGLAIRAEVTQPRYFKGTDLKNPYNSPVYGDFTGFPSLLIQNGSYEVLRDDSVMLAEAAKKAGVDVTISTYEGMSHVFQLVLPKEEASQQAWLEMGNFVNKIF